MEAARGKHYSHPPYFVLSCDGCFVATSLMQFSLYWSLRSFQRCGRRIDRTYYMKGRVSSFSFHAKTLYLIYNIFRGLVLDPASWLLMLRSYLTIQMVNIQSMASFSCLKPFSIYSQVVYQLIVMK